MRGANVRRKQRKFVIGSGLIILAVFYLSYSGYKESRSYSRTVPELYAMKDSAYGVRLQVSGNVVPGSIKREGSDVNFVIGQGPQTLPIRYVGKDPPDTLIDGATVLATGKMNRDGVFVADAILTKSASKTEHA
jgi:cytochrome c-type biogenesis protein CcmE